MAKVINLVFDQGANVAYEITVSDPDNQILDLSNYTPSCIFKKHQGSANSHAFNCSANSSGVVLMRLDGDTSANVAAGRYEYDAFILHDGTDTHIKIQEGIITVRPSVTR